MCLQLFFKKIWSKISFVGKKWFLVWLYQNSVKYYQNWFLDKILLQISLPKFGSEVWSKKWVYRGLVEKFEIKTHLQKRHFLVWLYQHSVENYQIRFRAGSYFKQVYQSLVERLKDFVQYWQIHLRAEFILLLVQNI